MGTRSLTQVHDSNGEILVELYRQFDGYCSGHGEELREFLKGMQIINGIGMNVPDKAANGMACLAAQLVTHFKEQHRLGGFYLYAPKKYSKEHHEEYNYVIYPPTVNRDDFGIPLGEPTLKCYVFDYSSGKVIDGSNWEKIKKKKDHDRWYQEREMYYFNNGLEEPEEEEEED